MTKIKRRDLLRQAGSLLITSAGVSACCGPRAGAEIIPRKATLSTAAQARATAVAFQHGVASGDPGTDRVILWTRVQPLVSTSPNAVTVNYWVSTDPAGRQRVAEGQTPAKSAHDYTIHLDIQGLDPDRHYYYGFEASGASSPTGRTRTLPEQSDHVRLAMGSCSNYAHGYFNAYARIAERDDLHAMVHLGDYIYEGDPQRRRSYDVLVRTPEPPRSVRTLADYRLRHAHYRSDPDLQLAHQRHPWICIWDDHEIANNASRNGAPAHLPRHGSYASRLAAAVQAYYEWMPIRRPSADDPLRIYRKFRFGKLCELVMLDGRIIGRDPQLPRNASPTELADPKRSMLGERQERWLADTLTESKRAGVRWRLLGQQTMLGQLQVQGRPPNLDQWDGYPAARKRLFDTLQRSQIDNLVVLTGDIHSSWAIELAPDPFNPTTYDPATGRGALAVEIVCPGLTSGSPYRSKRVQHLPAYYRQTHPHVRYLEAKRQGYVVLDVQPERMRCEWYLLPTVTQHSTEQVLDQALDIPSGTARLQPAPH